MALIRIRTGFTGVPGTPWLSNFYFDEDLANAQVCADTAASFWEQAQLAMSSLIDWAQDGVATVLDPATGEPTDVASYTPNTGDGQGSGDMLPASTQLLITWRTGVFAGGRELRGKTFVPGLVSSTNDNDGTIDEGVVTQFAGYADDLLTTPGNAQIVVWSRKNGTTPQVTGSRITNEWAVLRSRRD